MNRDRRSTTTRRREYKMHAPSDVAAAHEPDDVAPWLIAEVHAWPSHVDDRQIATRIGVGVQQVRRARNA